MMLCGELFVRQSVCMSVTRARTFSANTVAAANVILYQRLVRVFQYVAGIKSEIKVVYMSWNIFVVISIRQSEILSIVNNKII